jgi:hypothetical protein
MASSLLTLPIELVYRILDNLNEKTIFLSIRNVCTRLNTIIDTYHRYRVNFSFVMKLVVHYLRNIIHVRKVSSGFEYFLLIFALRLGLAPKVVGLDTELNSLSNGSIFNGGHRAKKGARILA